MHVLLQVLGSVLIVVGVATFSVPGAVITAGVIVALIGMDLESEARR